MYPTRPTSPDLEQLVGLFYSDPDELGRCEEVAGDVLPPEARQLLDHHEHMTVTVEGFHNSPVDVQVLETNVTPSHYARKILLTRQSDGAVVQFGIVRLNLGFLDPEVRREIESQRIPLGRVLISHNVLREVQLSSLWKITAGDDLARHMPISPGQEVYGRTALIFVAGEPAVELLEIVTPV